MNRARRNPVRWLAALSLVAAPHLFLAACKDSPRTTPAPGSSSAAAIDAAPPGASSAAAIAAATPQQLGAWRDAMTRAPMSKEGCFRLTYPDTAWEEVTCAPSPKGPVGSRPPRTPAKPRTEGIQSAGLIKTSDNSIVVAYGTFRSLTNASTELTVSSDHALDGGTVLHPNSYGLQLNTNTFTAPAGICKGTYNPPGCSGFQQFVLAVDEPGLTGSLLMQAWAFAYDATCPKTPGWAEMDYDGGIDCIYTTAAIPVPMPPLAGLTDVELIGATGETMDGVFAYSQGHLYQKTQSGLGLKNNWSQAAFDIVGDANGQRADFSYGTTLVLEVGVVGGNVTTNTTCQAGTLTGESSNLTTLQPCCPLGGPYQSFLFTESNAENAKSVCVCPANTTWNPLQGACVCNVAGKALVDGQCITPLCTPRALGCTTAGVPEQCNALGSAWTILPACKTTETCEAGRGCVARPPTSPIAPPKCPCGGTWPNACRQC